ncbi:hypothetical protein H4W30_004309 [Amycolatopsis roodepoortensis]|uniref:Uncharacterized protein n=1 Tax=Amycolatopsis roodepoortensis TaxID=700274 RepID=A0ABR9L983_9PSEU|nr:hypothetical protein [Amycolatopsis roodepoortensis]
MFALPPRIAALAAGKRVSTTSRAIRTASIRPACREMGEPGAPAAATKPKPVPWLPTRISWTSSSSGRSGPPRPEH